MALRECAALAVLARKAYWEAVAQERTEGERFRGRPVDPVAAVYRRAAILEEAEDRLMDVEALGRRGDPLADLRQPSEFDAGLAATIVVGDGLCRLDSRPAAVEPIGLVGRIGLAGLEFRLEALAPIGAHLVDLALGDDALGDELLGVDLKRRRM